MVKINPELLRKAFKQTDEVVDQIQGFHYGQEYVIRNCSLKMEHQILWKKSFTPHTEEEVRKEFDEHIEIEKLRIVCVKYNQLTKDMIDD